MSTTDKTGQDEPEGLTFPTEYPIKVMGENTDAFFENVFKVVQSHAPEVSQNSVRKKTSSNGKYQSITILVYAHSRDHLINIYTEVRTVEGVAWTL